MNHYPHHIGDFNNATRHLTRVERSLYRDLIELYYDTEQALNGDFEKLARRIICEDCDKPALRDVLNEFFVLQDDGWHNHRCDAEIAKYQGQIEQASRAGKASAAKRSNPKATTVERTLNDRSNSVDVPLNQPEPEPEPEPIRTDGFALFWQAYPKKTAKPAAAKAFKAAKINGHLPDVLKDIESRSSSDDWTKNSGQFVPNPATYLNQRRWEDGDTTMTTQSLGVFL